MSNKVPQEQMRQMCENAKKLGMRPDRLMLLDERLTEWCKNGITPSIVVRVQRHGQLAFEGAYGVLGPDKEPDSLTTDTIYPLCSVTKPLVATLLCIMQEEGLIDLNQPVRQYLPEFIGDKKSAIHIWHLLTHTSGIIDDDVWKYKRDYVTTILGMTLPKDEDPHEAWIDHYIKVREKMNLPYMEPDDYMINNTNMILSLMAPPSKKPHETMAYCNNGYQMAMEIIKRISGKPIDDYAGEKLFDPLKMIDSHFIMPSDKVSRFVTRSKEFVGSNWLNENVLKSESGSGGLKSTVFDMTQFGQMYLNGGILNGKRVLSPASIREITSDHNETIPPVEFEGTVFNSSWGLGWNIRGTKKDDAGMLRSPGSYDHGGFGCCKLMCDPQADIVAAYFTVCKTDCYMNATNFNNMIIAAIDDY